MNLESLVAEFVDRLSRVIESDATERARAAVLAALGSAPRRGPGRPPKARKRRGPKGRGTKKAAAAVEKPVARSRTRKPAPNKASTNPPSPTPKRASEESGKPVAAPQAPSLAPPPAAA